jgi:hypothetical protein
MKRSEIDALYPEDGAEELMEIIADSGNLDKNAEEASQWMISRN